MFAITGTSTYLSNDTGELWLNDPQKKIWGTILGIVRVSMEKELGGTSMLRPWPALDSKVIL